MSIFGKTKEEKTQLHFYGDGSFEFRKRHLLVEDNCLVEKDDNVIRKVWPHYEGAEYQFDGYKKLQPAMVSLSMDRDIIFDPFDKIPISDDINGKPKRDTNAVKKWLASIGESQRYRASAKPGTSFITNRVTNGLLIINVLFALGFLISRIT